MKADMQREICELHTQLNYWQNKTITILRDQHHKNTGGKSRVLNATPHNIVPTSAWMQSCNHAVAECKENATVCTCNSI